MNLRERGGLLLVYLNSKHSFSLFKGKFNILQWLLHCYKSQVISHNTPNLENGGVKMNGSLGFDHSTPLHPASFHLFLFSKKQKKKNIYIYIKQNKTSWSVRLTCIICFIFISCQTDQ